MQATRTRNDALIATVATLTTSALVALVASRPGSPFTPDLFPGAGAPSFLVRAASAIGLDRLPRDVVAVIGAATLFAASAAFIYSLREAWRGSLTVRRVIAVGLLLHVLALVVPLFLSRDVYSYAIYGRMVSVYGVNPYTEIPASFASDPVYPLVSVDWIDSRSVYGPAFTVLSAGVTRAVDSPTATVFSFKVVAAVASVLTMLLVVAAARRVRPERSAFAAALIGWNPVVVFHGVAGGHNDAVLGLAVAAGALALLARRELWGTAALALGTLVKVSGAIPLIVAVAAAVIRRPRGQRLRAFGLHVAVIVAISAPFVLPFMQTEDPTLGTLEVATRQGWLAPSRFVLIVFRGAANFLGGEVAGDVMSLIVRVAFPAMFAWVLVGLIRHFARDPSRIEPVVVVGAMGWASLISLMVSPVLLPWYVAWLIPLAWLLPRPARAGAVLVSVALAITELVAEPARAPRVWEAMVFGLHYVATPLVLFVLIWLLLELRRRLVLAPAPGSLHPLLIAESAQARGAPASRPKATAASALTGASVPAGGPRRDVAESSQGEDGGHPGESAGSRPQAVRDERAQDGDGDTD